MKECLIEEIKALIRENDMFGTQRYTTQFEEE